jgi:hypothetical protein
LRISVPATLEAAGMSMRDSATSVMRGWEQQKPDGSRSRLILSSAVFTRKLIKSTLRLRGSHFVYEKEVQNKPQNKKQPIR